MKKKLIIVNNDMHLGGVQKSLLELLKEIHKDYCITLVLFGCRGELLSSIPSDVRVIETISLYHCFGISHEESRTSKSWFFIRGILVVLFRLIGRSRIMPIIDLSQRTIDGEYDVAIAFFQNSGEHYLYGGCNDFVLKKINAKKKITFLHCDYRYCGSHIPYNDKQYEKFDKIAACSDGCKNSFISVLPYLSEKIQTVVNCHDYGLIQSLAADHTVQYDSNYINIVTVARLSEEKGIDRGLKAITHNNNIFYHVVGDGPQHQELQKLVEELGLKNRVLFYGYQVNPYRFVANADALFIPSKHEAAPLVIDEARCLSVPVISTRTTSSSDMIVERMCGWECENSQEGLNAFMKGLNKTMTDGLRTQMSKVEINNKLFREQFNALLLD